MLVVSNNWIWRRHFLSTNMLQTLVWPDQLRWKCHRIATPWPSTRAGACVRTSSSHWDGRFCVSWAFLKIVSFENFQNNMFEANPKQLSLCAWSSFCILWGTTSCDRIPSGGRTSATTASCGIWTTTAPTWSKHLVAWKVSWNTPCSRAPTSPHGKVSSGRRHC